MESFEKKFPATSHAKKKNPCMARSKKNNNARVVQPKKKSYKSYSYIPACGLPNLSHSHTSYALSLNKARFSQNWESMQRDYMPTSITDAFHWCMVQWHMMASRKRIAKALVSSPTHLESKEILHIVFMFEKFSTQHPPHTHTFNFTNYCGFNVVC